MGTKEFKEEMKRRFGTTDDCQKCGGELIVCPHCNEAFYFLTGVESFVEGSFAMGCLFFFVFFSVSILKID